ncbi:NFATC2-interacting protein [Mugil cephalus]|uniref:NFATC2-interacting protein n=1 Tax=Mugil cephalus TaxID=48193 RepID=UPI001FB5E4DD|nr:NFATC2-interacting protein [Mugil cephalus]
MAEKVSDSPVRAANPPPKRRRILDSSAIVPVPVYSNKVNSSLQLKPSAALFAKKDNTDEDADDSLWSAFSSGGRTAPVVSFSDSEDEVELIQKTTERTERRQEAVHCPSPPPPIESPVHKNSRKVTQKINEIDKRLQEVNSLLSPELQGGRGRSRRRRGALAPPPIEVEPDCNDEDDDDDDVIIMSPSGYSPFVREIPLKIRCRTDVHKIPVLCSTLLSDVATRLSSILNVPPSRLLLMREEVELQTDSTVSELGLGIADIIDCVVMAEENLKAADDGSIITVRLQSKDKDSSQEFSLNRDAPLGSIFSQYLCKMSAAAQTKVRFHFDGSKVAASQTPAQLNMEDGDIIEVWI